MTVHFLVRYKEGFMTGLHHRACDPDMSYVTKDRNKKQGSFSRKDVTCGNCKRTNVYKKQALMSKELTGEEENQKYTKPCPYNKSIPCVQYPDDSCGCDPCGECEIKLEALKG